MPAKSKVLIVEDENIVALDIKRRIEKLGYAVTGMASQAQRAIGLIREERPDIILMDIHLKGDIDGVEIADCINREFQIPIIFVTAYSEDTTLRRAKSTRPYGYLLKPFSEPDLNAVIQIALERARWDQELQQRERHLALAMDAANLGSWETANGIESCTILKHIPRQGLHEITHWQELYATIDSADREKLTSNIEALKSGAQASFEVEFEAEDEELGHRYYVMYGITTRHQMEKGPARVVGVIQDLSERKLTEEKLNQASLVFQSSADAIVIVDEHMRIDNANEAFYRITGAKEGSAEGQPLEMLSAKNVGQQTAREIGNSLENQGHWKGEIRAYRNNRQLYHALVNISSVPRSLRSGKQYMVMISDITEIREAQQELARIAFYDSLTELPNRNLFMDRLDLALAQSDRQCQRLAIFFVDIDHFKRVNDTLGHQVGDEMLRAVAGRLKSALRRTDTLCRLGGDEFIVIVDTFDNEEDLATLAEKLMAVIHTPLQLGPTEVLPNCSIGISIYPTDTRDRDDLIKMADTAMYAAKNEGRSRYTFYRPQMTRHIAHYMTREQELRAALRNEEFLLHFQPQYHATTQEILGLEALIRWEHPELGLLSAAEIIPIAESSPLIVEIGEWVIECACRQFRQWCDEGLDPVRIAINVSVQQLRDPNFYSVVASGLERNRMPGDFLELEVTESSLQHCETGLKALRQLEPLGVKISIDDFGTGYSCMSSLKFLPVHRLKIDQSFVKDIPENESDCAIASAIIVLGHELKLSVIAEGIETREQAEFVRKAGCDELQGYLLSRPVSATNAGSLLRERTLQSINGALHPSSDFQGD